MFKNNFSTNLFLINTLIEGVFGVIVLAYPSFMFHDAAYNPTAQTAGRMAGAAMLALGVISYEGYKSSTSRKSIATGMLLYHATILLLGLYSFNAGGYLPGPEVNGVPPILKLGMNAATHASLAFGFFKFLGSKKFAS